MYISCASFVYVQNMKTEVLRGSKQATAQEWHGNGTQSTVPRSIPEALVEIADTKPVEVVSFANPEEFYVQVTASLYKYYVLLYVLNEL
jgi:hypothetical protein